MKSSPEYEPIRWGVLGTGNIAHKFANAMQRSSAGQVVAVASRSEESAQQYQTQWQTQNAYGSYELLLDDPSIEAVFIALPNHIHSQWALKAAQAGKHILCEKPSTTNAHQARELIKALETHPVFFAENFLYRFHPQTKRLYQLIQDKAIGDIRLIQADFCFPLGLNYDNIRMSHALGGGGIMDVGCYTVSMARLLAGATLNQPYAEPVLIQGSAHLDPKSGVDLWASAILTFENGVIANLTCSTQCKASNQLTILGSDGRLEVPTPWKPMQTEVIRVFDNAEQMTTHEISTHTDLMGLEFEHLQACIRRGELNPHFPAMTRQESVANMAVLDAWRNAVGLQFEPDLLGV